MKNSISVLLVLLLMGTSCVSGYRMNFIRVEVMKPSKIITPETIDTIAIFTRDINRMDTSVYKYFHQNKPILDSSFHYRDIYNACVDALAETLEKDGHFLKVINCRDSLITLISGEDSTITYKDLHKKLGADVLVFLEDIKLIDSQYTKNNPFTEYIKSQFREFAKSSSLANINGKLFWTVRIKGDANRKVIRLHDDLYYGNSINPELFGNKENHQLMLENIAIYFAKAMGETLIPSWQEVDRCYYLSRTPDMKKAASYCNKGEWLKAAEIYKRNTNHKNHNIAAQASYNMALACEMEGELEAATYWLTRSEQTTKITDKTHTEICNAYLKDLEERKKEIEELDKLEKIKAEHIILN